MSALLLAVTLGYFLFRMPFQVSDNIGNMLAVREGGFLELMRGQFTAKGFLRPLLWANLKLLFDLPGGHYFEVFRAFHAVQLIALFLLFVRLLRVRTGIDFAACSLALLVLVGGHTFAEFVREAHPVSAFLSIAIYCLAAINLSASRGGWWADAAAALLFVVAALSVETGLLVWVCLVAAYAVGFRGVSARGLGVATALLAAYFVLRFGPLSVGAPGLEERSAGFGFGRLEPDQLTERFGPVPMLFYVSNVVSSLLTVPLAEPRAGIWELTRALSAGDMVPPWMAIAVASSVLTTALIVAHIVRTPGRWRRPLEHGDRLIAIAAVVLCANAVISYPYTKDVIMSPAGVCYAAAAYVGIRAALMTRRRTAATVLLTTVLLTSSTLWAVRTIGLGYNMRHTAFVNRNDWTGVFEFLEAERIKLDGPDSRVFVERLQRQMMEKPLPNPYFFERDAEPYFDQH